MARILAGNVIHFLAYKKETEIFRNAFGVVKGLRMTFLLSIGIVFAENGLSYFVFGNVGRLCSKVLWLQNIESNYWEPVAEFVFGREASNCCKYKLNMSPTRKIIILKTCMVYGK